MSKIVKWLISLLAILIALNLVILTNLLVIKYRYNYHPIDCARIKYYPSKSVVDISREDAIMLVDELFDIRYTLRWDDLKSKGLLGTSMVVLNIVTLDNTLSGWEIISTLTHELCHIKYYSSNETFIEYISFVELYESGIDILENRAEWLIYEQCVIKIRANTEYDCSWYIIEYLKSKFLI